MAVITCIQNFMQVAFKAVAVTSKKPPPCFIIPLGGTMKWWDDEGTVSWPMFIVSAVLVALLLSLALEALRLV